MNQVEQMQGQVAALSLRLSGVEQLLRMLHAAGADEVEAAKVAQAIGFPVDILLLPEALKQRQELARQLKIKGWGYERIGRALNCSEKSIRRWATSGAKSKEQGAKS
jgi:hypothetical protein